MDSIVLIIGSIALVTGIAGAGYFILFRPAAASSDMQQLLSRGERRDKFGNKIELDIDLIKKETTRKKNKSKKKPQEDVATKLFRAGYYSMEDRRFFLYMQIAVPIVSVVVCTLAFMSFHNPLLVGCGMVLGAFIGLAAPLSWLERKIRVREEETMYYLPLVIEQISIGVSSALDIGPCIAHITQMAKERETFNPVTEMLIHTEKLIVSGLNLGDSLVEVSEANGSPDVKHAFMFLAQCAKHGGEISRQLQELANAVMAQRQVQVEGRITALPVKATLPLTCVFFGFFLILGSGIFVKLITAFGPGAG